MGPQSRGRMRFALGCIPTGRNGLHARDRIFRPDRSEIPDEMKLRILAAAEIEVELAYDYYELQWSGLGRRIIAEVRDALEGILTFPEAHPIWTQAIAGEISKNFHTRSFIALNTTRSFSSPSSTSIPTHRSGRICWKTADHSAARRTPADWRFRCLTPWMRSSSPIEDAGLGPALPTAIPVQPPTCSMIHRP
jgi:hypothetical protein